LLGLINQVSIVVPTLNAATTLPYCLDPLVGVGEIIVTDGGSTDDSRAVAEKYGARWLTSAPGRGAQLRKGAAAAAGDWLLFLHADTVLDRDWDAAAEQHMGKAPEAAGYFRFRLNSPAWQARMIEAGVRLRVRMLALPYGDQALLIRRDVYGHAGGYRPLPLLEDLDLVRRLGRRRLREIRCDAVTSAARWREDGWLSRSTRNGVCLALYYAGASPERIAGLYAGPERARREQSGTGPADLRVR
jgi:rSAM/selenodomain-associated transferase 2